MQLLFAPGSEWGLEWMPRVLPNIVKAMRGAAAVDRLHALHSGTARG
jgi:hypothetical protein